MCGPSVTADPAVPDGRAGPGRPGLYVHLPFCPYICPYCDFAKWAYRGSDAARYLAALHVEIDRPAPARPAATLFFGGGTPSTYEPEAIAGLIAHVRERFDLDAEAEISLEANPEPTLPGALPGLRAAGVNRLSIGVQSLVDEELATLGRRHRHADVERAVRAARVAGFTDLSLDLIFAVPGQTVATWRTTLERALALAPDHVSTYGLTIEEGTPYADWFAREPGRFPASDTEAEMYEVAIETLEGAGFEHYEISNFARPGHRCRHNEMYWANGTYLGLGVGAASFLEGERSVATRDLATYVAALENGAPVPRERERLRGRRAAGEAAMLRLRTAEGIDVATFAGRYGLDPLATYAPAIAEFEPAGLLVATASRIALTPRGRFVANDVCAAFLGDDDVDRAVEARASGGDPGVRAEEEARS